MELLAYIEPSTDLAIICLVQQVDFLEVKYSSSEAKAIPFHICLCIRRLLSTSTHFYNNPLVMSSSNLF